MEQRNKQSVQEETENKPPVKTNWKFIGGIVILCILVSAGIIWISNKSIPGNSLSNGGKVPVVCRPTYDPTRWIIPRYPSELTPPIEIDLDLQEQKILVSKSIPLTLSFTPLQKAPVVKGEIKASGVISVLRVPNLYWQNVDQNQKVTLEMPIRIDSFGKGDILWVVQVMDAQGKRLFGTSLELYLLAGEDGVVSNRSSSIYLDVQYLNRRCELGKVDQAEYDQLLKELIKEMSRGEGITVIGRDYTKDWQTYRNDEFGFEVKYPRNWRIIEDYAPEKIIFDSEGDTKTHSKYSIPDENDMITELTDLSRSTLQPTVNGKMQNPEINYQSVFDEWLDDRLGEGTFQNKKNVTIGENQWIEVHRLDQQQEFIFLFFLRDKYQISIIVPSRFFDTLTVQQILSTFRFVE